MMVAAEPWQRAEIPGPKKATAITSAKVISAMLKKAKRPLLVVGHEVIGVSLGEESLVSALAYLARRLGIPLVATAQTVKSFLDGGFKPAASMSIMEVGSRLADSDWKGIDGKGQYDLVLFIGYTYYVLWNVLSGLKNFAPHLKAMSLDRYYHPNAAWSLPNLSHDDWIKNMRDFFQLMNI